MKEIVLQILKDTAKATVIDFVKASGVISIFDYEKGASMEDVERMRAVVRLQVKKILIKIKPIRMI